MTAPGPADQKLFKWRRVFAILIALAMVAYIAFVWFGGRIPGRFLLLPFVPV